MSCFLVILSVWRHLLEHYRRGHMLKYLNLVPSPWRNQTMHLRNPAMLCDTGSVAQSSAKKSIGHMLKPRTGTGSFKRQGDWLPFLKQMWHYEQKERWNPQRPPPSCVAFTHWPILPFRSAVRKTGSRHFQAVSDWRGCFCSSTLPFRVSWERHTGSNAQHKCFRTSRLTLVAISEGSKRCFYLVSSCKHGCTAQAVTVCADVSSKQTHTVALTMMRALYQHSNE